MSCARPALDTSNQVTDRAANKSWKDQTTKCRKQGLKRHKRDRRTSSPKVRKYHVEVTHQAFANEATQNPACVWNRIETKLSHMEMVLHGLETTIEGMTGKITRVEKNMDKLQKSLA